MGSTGLFGAAELDPSTIPTTLLNKIQVRDQSAWKKLVQLYGTLVYRWCRQGGFQPTDAADLVQEVFLSVLFNVEKFERSDSGHSFRGWLWKLTRSRMADRFRKRFIAPDGLATHLPSDHPEENVESAADVHLPGERARLIARLLRMIEGDFEPVTWQAFWRTTVDGQTAAEVAADLGLKPGTVRQAKFRVFKRLRQELESLK